MLSFNAVHLIVGNNTVRKDPNWMRKLREKACFPNGQKVMELNCEACALIASNGNILKTSLHLSSNVSAKYHNVKVVRKCKHTLAKIYNSYVFFPIQSLKVRNFMF